MCKHTASFADSSFAPSPWMGFVASSVSVFSSLGSELASTLGSVVGSAIFKYVKGQMQYLLTWYVGKSAV
jgi:hypothetical protein